MYIEFRILQKQFTIRMFVYRATATQADHLMKAFANLVLILNLSALEVSKLVSATANRTLSAVGAISAKLVSGTLRKLIRKDVKLAAATQWELMRTKVNFKSYLFFKHLNNAFLSLGCNVYSGECVCKRYVTGRDCDTCLPEHWGLSENNRDGCKPCDCDVGGSYDNSCDIHSGQCKCRPHATGRTCSHPEQGYFAGSLDFRVYEAEYGGISDRGQLMIREPYRYFNT